MTAVVVGTWDAALFAAFRAAEGPRRRFLLGQLLVVNTPLIKKLVAQISGVQEHASHPRGYSFAGKIKVRGADGVDWEDLMQAGRIGMADALERLDPAKGRIATIAYWRILYEIQKVFRKYQFFHVPEGHEAERPGIAFVAEQDALDRMSMERAGACFEVEGITAATVADWAANDSWPELDEWRPRPMVSVPVALPLDSITAFLRAACQPRSRGRVANADLWSAYLAHCGGVAEVAKPVVLQAARARFRAKDLHIRTRWSAAERALSGFCLAPSVAIP